MSRRGWRIIVRADDAPKHSTDKLRALANNLRVLACWIRWRPVLSRHCPAARLGRLTALRAARCA
eukprot:5169795-Lingulodinium_polyedra.AAC.1